MGKTQFPQKFVDEVLETFPGSPNVRRALEEGDDSKVRSYLANEPTAVDAVEVLGYLESGQFERLANIARRLVQAQKLYRQCLELPEG